METTDVIERLADAVIRRETPEAVGCFSGPETLDAIGGFRDRRRSKTIQPLEGFPVETPQPLEGFPVETPQPLEGFPVETPQPLEGFQVANRWPLSSVCAVRGGDGKRAVANGGSVWRERLAPRGRKRGSASDSKSLEGLPVAAQAPTGEQDLGNRRLRAPELSSGARRSARDRAEAGESADIDTALERIRDLGAMAGPKA